MSRLPIVVIAIALIAGAFLRFAYLGSLEMSADEGATWAAAHAPSIREVVMLQQTHNAGKLPLHDLLLHGWIILFGDGVGAMRSLSALFGLISVAMMVPATREILHIDAFSGPARLSDIDIEMISAIAALICAVSVVTIKYDREARMYGLLLAIAVAHVWSFLRTLRAASIYDCAALTLLTCALVAVNLVTASLLAIEGMWLLVLLGSDMRKHLRRIAMTAVSMGAALAVLSPALYVMVQLGREVVAEKKVDWLVMPSWYEPLAVFNKATGSVVFAPAALLAIWGVRRGWDRARGGLAFATLLMFAPAVLLVIGSHAWRPMFIERYVLFSFPAFFVLIAIGIWELPSVAGLSGQTTRAIAAVALVALSLGHVYSYSRKTHDIDWREAARVASASIRPDQPFGVAPPYAVEVVRYYMNPELRAAALPYHRGDNPQVLILADHGVNAGVAAEARARFTSALAHPSGVAVLSQ